MSNEGSHRQLRTVYSGQAMELADRFTLRFAMTRLMPGEYTPQLSKPDGPSTLGGAQAMQHIRLVSKQPGVAPLHAGTCNQKEGTAELRSYEYIAAQHLARFKQPLALNKADYDAFLVEAGKFFTEAKLATTMATQAAIEAPASALAKGTDTEDGTAPTEAGPSPLLYVGVGIVISLVLLGLFAALR